MEGRRRGGNEELARAKGRSEKVREEPGQRLTEKKHEADMFCSNAAENPRQVKNEIMCHL